jgi:hypothetical protein
MVAPEIVKNTYGRQLPALVIRKDYRRHVLEVERRNHQDERRPGSKSCA